MLKRSGVAAAEAITIGDEARDIEASRAAGIACGAVKWGYATPALLQSLAPNLLFDSVDEIPERIAAQPEALSAHVAGAPHEDR